MSSRRPVSFVAPMLIVVASLLPGCASDDVANPQPPPIEKETLPSPVLDALRDALSFYEEARSALARDRREDARAPAAALAAALESAEVDALSPRARSLLAETRRAAASLVEASDLEGSRNAFGELSRLLLVVANVDPRVLEGWRVYSCPMTKTFPKWMQPPDGPDGRVELENPFMGQGMPGCGVESDTSVAPPPSLLELQADDEQAQAGDVDVAYYTCSMHPSVRREAPGTCPICSMDLVPVTREERDTGIIFVGAQRRQAIGVRTAAVERRPSSVRLRAAGKLVYDETRLADVTLKYRGWIGALYADTTGARVQKGDPLFTLYSPELYAAQEELATALASQAAARETSAPNRADYLVEAARTRLRLWDVGEAVIEEIARTGEPQEYLPIASPVTGYVIEKNVAEGATVEPGERLYRIAGLDTIWIEAEVYESELPLVTVGQRAEVTLTYLPGKTFRGRVSFIYPFLEGRTRTGRVRIELPNPRLELKPDMYANVELGDDRGERLVVPEEAVIYAGPRRLVFVDLGDGRLRPQEIEVGIKTGDYYEVLEGLEEGDVVVTSGNFLIAAESRLKSSATQW